jgi:hypothetical protein
MTRRLPIILAAVVAVLAAGSFALWRWAETRMEQGFADWQATMAAQGWTVHAGATSRHGWPLAAELAVDDLAISGGLNVLPGGGAYAAQRVAIRFDLLEPSVVTVRGEGNQSVRLDAGPTLPFTADRLVVTVPVAQPTSAVLDAGGMRFGAPAEGLTIGLLQGQADWHATSALALRLSAEAITLPPPPAPQAPLGAHIASATFEGEVTGTLPATPPSPAAAAAAWRDSGGAVTLRRIALGWGPLGVAGNATLKLDKDLQPDVTATLRLVGLDETLTVLANARAITPRAAQTAKAVVGLMAHAPEGGGTPGVEVPLTVHDRAVSIGMIPLATLGKLDWPGAP